MSNPYFGHPGARPKLHGACFLSTPDPAGSPSVLDPHPALVAGPRDYVFSNCFQFVYANEFFENNTPPRERSTRDAEPQIPVSRPPFILENNTAAPNTPAIKTPHKKTHPVGWAYYNKGKRQTKTTKSGAPLTSPRVAPSAATPSHSREKDYPYPSDP